MMVIKSILAHKGVFTAISRINDFTDTNVERGNDLCILKVDGNFLSPSQLS
jgi:hypothetical protein